MRKHFERPVYVLLIICLLLTENNAKRELRLLGLLPMTGDGWSGGIACLPAIEMAVDDVNTVDSILKNYKLVYEWIDSKCDPQISLYRMLEALYNEKPYTMILGAGCSIASEATAKITHLWNLNQLSYASSSPTLSDRKKFPRFFRLALPDQKLNAARIDLMRKFDWTKVATINQALDIFSAVTDDFVKSVQDTNITIISQPVFSNDPKSSVKKLKKRDARIIMTAMYEDKAREVLCAAYKVGLYGPKVVWVFVGWFSTTFWKYHLDGVNCTEDEMDKAAEGSFITGPAYSNPMDERGIANMTVSAFEARFHNYSSYNKSNTVYDFYAPQCYDHVWVAAKALECADKRLREQVLVNNNKPYHVVEGKRHKAITDWSTSPYFTLPSNGIEGYRFRSQSAYHGKGLEEFTYNDTAINEIIFQCMENTSLTGVSGRVMFSSDGDPKRVVKMERIQDGVRQDIGLYRQDKDPKYFEWIDGAIKWKDGTVPRDSTVVKNVERGIPTILYGTMAVLSGLGINITIALFIFNVIYRKNRFVKLSSPNINNILLLGCVICYATVFIKTTDIVNVAMCKIRIFCLSLGFTVTFGALFAKTWRVYRIFTNKKLLKRAIKDYQLMAIIVGMVAVILFIIILWETICPHEIKVKFLHKEVYMTGNDTEARPYVRVCRSGNSDIFEWVLYISQGALLIFGAFLAFETREVKIKALNDSHQIGLCIYNVLVLSAVALTLSLILEDQEVLMYGITSACLILGTSMTEMIIFIPKIQSVLGKTDISDTPTGTGTGAISTNPSREMPSKVVSTEI